MSRTISEILKKASELHEARKNTEEPINVEDLVVAEMKKKQEELDQQVMVQQLLESMGKTPPPESDIAYEEIERTEKEEDPFEGIWNLVAPSKNVNRDNIIHVAFRCKKEILRVEEMPGDRLPLKGDIIHIEEIKYRVRDRKWFNYEDSVVGGMTLYLLPLSHRETLQTRIQRWYDDQPMYVKETDPKRDVSDEGEE